MITVGLPTDNSARTARNTQLILQEEASLTLVADPFGGSYMMEGLTRTLVEEVRQVLGEIEGFGGMTKYIASGQAKMRIEEAATRKQVTTLFIHIYTYLYIFMCIYVVYVYVCCLYVMCRLGLTQGKM